MKRRLAKLVVFLLLGAIVNVAVAWGCQYFPCGSIGTEFITLNNGRDSRSPTGFVKIQMLQAGWPFYSLRGEMAFAVPHFGVPVTGTRVSAEGAIPLRGSTTVLLPFIPEFLPASPIWLAFALNTFFYAGLTWVLLRASIAVRGVRRIRRGLCPACAYPVGTSAECTECGAELKAKSLKAKS